MTIFLFYLYKHYDILCIELKGKRLKRKFQYSVLDIITFYVSYFFYKLIIPFEVRKPRWKLWIYEWIYSLAKFIDYNNSVSWKHPIDTIWTKFGIFKIRINTSDAANVSPAFERRDQNYLIQLISRLISSGKRVLFLDIGADLGSYSVLVANKFKNKQIAIKTFEPISESCALIEENIKKNSIEDYVSIYPFALANENNDNSTMELNCDTPGSSTMKKGSEIKVKKQIHIKTKKLDDILYKETGDFDSIIFKIDVEGMEKEVILGSQKIIESKKEIYLMVEDFIDPEIIDYLHKSKWDFIRKVTSYNSWWFFKAQ